MASFFERLNKICTADEYCVSGYIRRESSKLKINIPYEIIQIIILFFAVFDKWSNDYKGKDILINGNIIKATSSTLNSVLGEQIMKSGVFYWKFKILDIDATRLGWRVAIGIIGNMNDEQKLKELMDTYLCRFRTVFITRLLVANSSNNDKSKFIKNHYVSNTTYGQLCKKNDVIEMYLDLDKHIIRFVLNGKYKKFRDKKIEKGAYRMGVSIAGSNTSIELISAKQLNQMPSL